MTTNSVAKYSLVHPIKDMCKSYKSMDSDHLAVYGLSNTKMYHIWSNGEEHSLCGRKIHDKIKLNKSIRTAIAQKEICSQCFKANKRRYGLFDLLPTVSFVTTMIGLFKLMAVENNDTKS